MEPVANSVWVPIRMPPFLTLPAGAVVVTGPVVDVGAVVVAGPVVDDVTGAVVVVLVVVVVVGAVVVVVLQPTKMIAAAINTAKIETSKSFFNVSSPF
jgi:hypothetical protein